MNRLELQDSVNFIICSPPYGNCRTYENLGLASFDFHKIAQGTLNVLKEGGVIAWIVGDTTENGSETGIPFEQALYFKSLGYRLHDTMIYQKNNFSNPSKTRYHQIFEYIFLFSKGVPKTFNPIKDRKNKYGGKVGSWGKNTVRQKDGSFLERKKKINSEYGMRYNIWKYKTSKNGQEDDIAYKHPAIFPINLAQDLIISFTNPGDLVYDPLAGSGTSLKAAKDLNRQYIGSEIVSNYCDIINERLS
jgi:site-specific DNA-methyltransferase (adenine-specific)